MRKRKLRKISLIVPAYRQEKTIVSNIKKLAQVMRELRLPFEIIVVVDGRLDKTYERIKKHSSSRIRVYQYKKNQGKGYAVRFGALKAKGDVIGFLDAGLDIDPNGVSMLLNHMIWYDADVIVGSKMHPASQVDYPFYRKIISWGYRTVTHLLFGLKIRDTQAGIKFYKKKVVEDVFPRLLVKSFAFDIEVLALAHALGYKRIYEAPIKLQFTGISSMNSRNLWKVILLTLLDTLAIFYRVRILKYYKKSNQRNWLNNKTKRILVLNWRDPYHPLAGGAEISLHEHVKYWIKKGMQVTWFTSSYDGAKPEETREGVLYIRRGNHFTSFILFLFYYNFRNLKFEIVIDCFHFFPYFSIFYKGKPRIVALINEVAGRIWFQNLPYPLAIIGYVAEPVILRLYNRKTFITGSQSAKNDLVKLGLESKRIKVVNHGFTPSKKNINNKKEELSLVFLARISKDKGIEDALEVLRLLLKKHKKAKLTIIGKSESPEYQKSIKKLIRKKNIQKNCIIVGFVTEKEKFEYLSKAKLLIHPSIKEGWGLNVIEANSVGTPAVGYRVAGLVDSIVDDVTGKLVDQDINSLYRATLEILEDQNLYLRLSKEAVRWSKRFSWGEAGRKSYKILYNHMKIKDE